MKKLVNVPGLIKVDSGEIGLKTTGARVKSVTHNENLNCYSVVGEIDPYDPEASIIEFQVNLPEQWNGKAIHFGGGGTDGVLVTGLYSDWLNPTVLPDVTRGYVTLGSDGGHKAKGEGTYDGSFGLNDESLRNFGHEAIKKTKDVAMAITRYAYDQNPDYVYFSGGSNGGREGLKAIQLYPEDYDGIVCRYPVANWVGKCINDSGNGDLMEQPGHWISLEEVEKLFVLRQEVYKGYCTNELGIVCDLEKAKEKKQEVRERAKEFLSDSQIAMLDFMEEPLKMPYELANGITEVPGYTPWTGTVVSDTAFSLMGRIPDSRSGDMTQLGDTSIKYMIMQDEQFDPVRFDYIKYREQVQAASAILDATDPAIDRFIERGGKIILLHGIEDQLVTLKGTQLYFASLVKRFGADKVDEFCKFYIIPGLGHGVGFNFSANHHYIQTLDEWVTNDVTPDEITVVDESPYCRAFIEAYLSPEGLASMKIPGNVEARTQVIRPEMISKYAEVEGDNSVSN